MADAKKNSTAGKPSAEDKQAAAQSEVDALVKRGLKALEEFEELNQEQVDRIVSFVESVNKRGYYNEAISNIISEEAGAYFSGQKSARDVASVIQSRVQVYVNENR